MKLRIFAVKLFHGHPITKPKKPATPIQMNEDIRVRVMVNFFEVSFCS